jgi:hypothetical protein
VPKSQSFVPNRTPAPWRQSFAISSRTPQAQPIFAQKIAGMWLRYDLPGDHPLIGRSAPDLEFEDGTRLGAHLHDGTALLLNLNGGEKLHAVGERWAGRVKCVSTKAKDNLGLTALFVRPDGFVAWAQEGEGNVSDAQAALIRWIGIPSDHPVPSP